jgi:hypothetical protein
MAKIIIHRKSAFSHRFRPFEIYIDGEKAGLIKNGGTEEFTVSPGYHKVHCKMSWYYSEAFNVTLNEDEVKFLKVEGGPKFMGVIYTVLLAALITPIVFRSASWYDKTMFSNIRFAALAIIILHGLYYNYIKRKQYLRISEDKENIFNQ